MREKYTEMDKPKKLFEATSCSADSTSAAVKISVILFAHIHRADCVRDSVRYTMTTCMQHDAVPGWVAAAVEASLRGEQDHKRTSFVASADADAAIVQVRIWIHRVSDWSAWHKLRIVNIAAKARNASLVWIINIRTPTQLLHTYWMCYSFLSAVALMPQSQHKG